jgi:Calcineurin-like phosphoesterase
MIFSLLHLSDIHFRTEKNSLLEKVNNISRAVKSELYGIDNLIITITGDMAFSGKVMEYEVGIEFLETLKKNLLEERELKIYFVVIPGNHDCDFSKNQSIRKILIESVRSAPNNLSDDIIEQICSPQQNYLDFANLYEEEQCLIFNHKLFKQYKFQFEEKDIVFNCINTAWISELHEQPSKMYYPLHLFIDNIKNVNGDMIISILHHPLHWLEPTNNRINKEIIEENSDLVLTGHEHVTTFRQNLDFEGNYTGYIEGGALQTNNPGESSFNLISFDMMRQQQKILKYSWKEDKYIVENEIDWTDLRLGSFKSSVIENNDDFNNFLNDPGLTLNHPKKSNVTLDDIYIYPDAKVIKYESNHKEGTSEYTNLEIIKQIKEHNKFFITGEEKSGKSTLCKTIYKFYKTQEYVPVFLNGRDIKKSSIEDFNKVLYKSFVNQYSKTSLEEFKQLPDKKKLIIIDDYDQNLLNNHFSINLLSNIDKYYDNIIITGSELFKYFELLFKEDSSQDELANFYKFEIMHFGHKLRGQLINQWNSIGDLETLQESDLISKNDQFENTINTIIGNNYVPSYPFFIIVLLQTLESGQSHNLAESTYGYYYEHLIKQSLINLDLKNEDIDAFYNYITELAFVFFEDKVREKTKQELQRFHEWYSNEYISYTFDKHYEKLVNASILEHIQDVYKFKYNYAYYYFVARYLAININENEIRDKVSDMCKNLYYEEYANIIMFLTHISKDRFILNEVLMNAKAIFEEYEPTKLQDEVGKLNKLISNVPKVVLENKEVKEHRQKRLEFKDQIERSKNEVAPTEYDSMNEDTSELDIISKLNWSFKTLEIVGLILKNYYGSIKKTQQIILGSEAYFLGLRSLSSFLNMIDSQMESIVKEIEKVISEKGIHKKTDVENEARSFVFNICAAMSFHFIKKISSSVGTEKLSEIFNTILTENSTNAVRLIDISIKLDHIQKIPFNDITSLKKDLLDSNNLIAYNILRGLVLNHLYMFDTSYKDKQKICTHLDIAIQQQRKIDLISNVKK